MRLFRRYNTNSILYLMPIWLGNEKLADDKIRMLHSDAKGNINSTIMDKVAYELARKSLRKLKRTHRNFATVGVQTGDGNAIPFAVEIESEQVWALNHILEHALKKRSMPAILKKYPEQIIRLGETRYQEEIEDWHEKTMGYASGKHTPGVLYRLPYYDEDEVEMAIPIFKAEHRYPLIVLKRLPSDENTGKDMQRILVLDSDGDLAIIRIPSELLNQAERGFIKDRMLNRTNGCLIYSQHKDGFAMNHISISEVQKRALETIASKFEKTRRGGQPISKSARAVLAKVRNITASKEF